MTQIKYTLKCPQCGGTRFKAATAKPGPNDPVTCADCGTSIDLAAEKRRLEKTIGLPLHALSGKRATAVSTVQERDVIIIKNHASTPRHLNLPLGGESVGER
jgi:hypothetical protein